MFPIIEEWESTDESREIFCKRHDVPISTFSYWRTRYAKSRHADQSPKFVKLTPEPPSSDLEIIYPNGVKIRLPHSSSLSDLRTLIHLI